MENNKLYFLGAWQEIDGRFNNSLFSLIVEKNNTVERKYLNYMMDEKNWLIANLGIYNCLINKTHKVGRSIVTDGLWFWSTEVAHYVEHHNLVIPEGFIKNIEKNNCKTPTLSENIKNDLLQKITFLFSNLTTYDTDLWKLY